MRADLKVILHEGVSHYLFAIFISLLIIQQEFLNIYSHHGMLLAGSFRKGDERNLNKTPVLKEFLVKAN